jgi:photosynthetic reaction center cytochrome c subunit
MCESRFEPDSALSRGVALHMATTFVSRRIVAAAAGLVLTALIFAGAQQPQQLAGKTAEQAFKNIQVLKEIPAEQVVPTMRVMAGSLGVNCGFCHVEDRSKDDLMTKQTARKMITMMMEINKNNFDARQEVTCYTCHKGTNDPVSTLQYSDAETAAPGGGRERAQAPSVDQILANYVQALGGEQAMRKVSSVAIIETRDAPAPQGGAPPAGAGGRGGEAPAAEGRGGGGGRGGAGGGRGEGAAAGPPQEQIEQYLKAPNLMVNIVHAPNGGTTEMGFDGTTGWTQNARGVVADMKGTDEARTARMADFYEPLDLSKEYARLAVGGTAKIDVFAREHDAYVVIGTPQGEPAERLFFDTSTGLLIRKVVVDPTPAGNAPTQTDYDDYRDIGNGIKFPFLIRVANPPDARITATVRKVDTAPVDNSKFTKPESKPAPAQ